MVRLTVEDFKEIRSWFYRNARQIEIALWQFYFEGGSKEAVVKALSHYQNEDGGFGHALEADNWNPSSTPYTTLIAVNILKDINHIDMQHPMLKGIMKYLDSGVYCTDHGWYFNIPSNNDYAHAPWWEFKNEKASLEEIGVTAGLASFILQYGDSNSILYQKALNMAKWLIDNLRTATSYGDMGVGGYIILLDTIEKTGIDHSFDVVWLRDKVHELVNASIIRDTSKWVYYCVRPSEYIRTPESRFYEDSKDIVEKELNYLIDTRPKGGVWDITWSWYDNNEKYSKEFAISENWWKGSKAIEKLLFLRNFGRIE